jgi:GH35 family endo-1,4-beta-xylanase
MSTGKITRRSWFLLEIAIVVALMMIAILGCASHAPPSIHHPATIQVQSTAWEKGQGVTLTLQTIPPRIHQPLSITVLAPGSGAPEADNLHPDFFGLAGVQMLWLPAEQREIEIALSAASGARYIGLDFGWRRIEPEQDQYNWDETDKVVAMAKRYNLHLAPMLLYTPRWASTMHFAPLDYHRTPPTDYDDYREFVYAVVNRYKPHGDSPLTSDGYGITDWVIWNEPNVRSGQVSPAPGDFWIGSLEEYIQLLRAGYEGAHAADPTCNVLNGGLADVFWEEGELDLVTSLERLYDPNGDGNTADGGRPFFDTLNIHTYQVGMPTATWYTERIEKVLRVMARFGDEDKPIWITETGYGTTRSSANDSPDIYIDEATQADAAPMIYKTCSTYPQVERVFWWSLRDYHSNTSETNSAMEAHYGLVRANFAPKPAYLAYAQLTGSISTTLMLHSTTDREGIAQVSIPASFIKQSGRYIVFSELDERIQTAVDIYEVLPQEEGNILRPTLALSETQNVPKTARP